MTVVSYAMYRNGERMESGIITLDGLKAKFKAWADAQTR